MVGVARQQPHAAVLEGDRHGLVAEGHPDHEDPGLDVGGQMREQQNEVLIRKNALPPLCILVSEDFLPFRVQENGWKGCEKTREHFPQSSRAAE